MKTYLGHADLRATAQHITFIQKKLDQMREAKDNAWRQILTAAARGYAEEPISLDDLQSLHTEMKFCYGSGFVKVWDECMPIASASLRHVITRVRQNPPNGPMGSWMGLVHASGESKPWRGIAVVYVLFDAANVPIYVGSTGNFPSRLNTHRNEKPEAIRWTAYKCRDREHAYEVEDRLLREHKPAMNVRAGR